MNKFSVRVLVADDHPLSALGMSHALGGSGTIELLGTVANSTELVAILDRQQSDVLLVDYVMPGGKYGDGIALLSFLRRRYPALGLVTITMLDNPSVLLAIQQEGVGCILSKADGTSHLVSAIHAAFLGGKYLSPYVRKLLEDYKSGESVPTLTVREMEVVRLYGAGLSVGEIAAQLHRSKQTISTQKTSAMKKLGIVRDLDLIRYANDGLLPKSQAEGQPFVGVFES